MTLVENSLLYRICTALVSLVHESALWRGLCALGRGLRAAFEGSRLFGFLLREGRVAKSWPESALCRGLSFLINLPGTVLHAVYVRLRDLFEGSFFARLAFRFGDDAVIAQSWLILALWVIPYTHWNNAYSLIAFAFVVILFYAGSMRTGRKLDLAAVGFYPQVLLFAVYLGVRFSFSPASSGRFLIYHVSAALCVIATVSAVRSAGDLKRLCAAASVAVAVSSAYGVIQRIQGVEVNPSYVDVDLNADMPGRVFSYFDNPNTFAEVLILLLPLTLALIFCSRSVSGKLAAAGIFALGTAALAMTYSRASWVGFAVSLAVMVVLWKPRLIPLFILLCVAAVPLLPSTVWHRILTITNLKDSSTASRFPLYQAAFAVIRRDPVTGAGLGTAAVQYYIKRHYLYEGTAPFVHAHNFYLQVWLETGILGVTSFVASMLWNIKRAGSAARHTAPSPERTIACAAASSLCGAMVCGMADYLWNYPRVMCMFWFVFAAALSGVKLCRAGAEHL